MVLARGLPHGRHQVRVAHQPEAGEAGCIVSGFRVLGQDSGDLSFHLNGEENAFFVDARAVVRRGGEVVRDVLVRNWLTGACRLTGMPAAEGYSLELIACHPRRGDAPAAGIPAAPAEVRRGTNSTRGCVAMRTASPRSSALRLEARGRRGGTGR